MVDDPIEMFDEFIKALVAKDEERREQIQDQLAANSEAREKSDLLHQHLNAHKKALEDAEKWLYRTLRQPPQP